MLRTLLCVVCCLRLTCALDNGMSLTPHMGWSSWNMFKCHGHKPSLGDVSEVLVKQMADVIVKSGLAAAGYDLVNLDDCYQAPDRNATGHITGNNVTFPSGMKALGDYLHSKALRYGVYLDCGTATCQGFPGSQDNEELDAKTIAEWGADYMKYDECHSTDAQELHRFFQMRDALAASGRPIIYSADPIQSRCNGDPAKGDVMWDASPVANAFMCRGDGFHGGSAYCGKSQQTVSTHLGTKDITPTWNSVNCLLDANIAFDSRRFAGPGHWIISDILEVGNGMTTQEDESHFSLWCMMAWPLIMGHDARSQSNDTLRILTNKALLEVSQDPMGKPARLLGGPTAFTQKQQTYIRQLHTGDYAVVLFNRDDHSAQPMTLHWADLGLLSAQPVLLTDMWHGNSSTTTANFTVLVPSHGVVALKTQQMPTKEYHTTVVV